MYSMCMNGYAFGNFNKKNLLYMDGHPWTHENIAGFINRSRSSLYLVQIVSLRNIPMKKSSL